MTNAEGVNSGTAVVEPIKSSVLNESRFGGDSLADGMSFLRTGFLAGRTRFPIVEPSTIEAGGGGIF